MRMKIRKARAPTSEAWAGYSEAGAGAKETGREKACFLESLKGSLLRGVRPLTIFESQMFVGWQLPILFCFKWLY